MSRAEKGKTGDVGLDVTYYVSGSLAQKPWLMEEGCHGKENSRKLKAVAQWMAEPLPNVPKVLGSTSKKERKRRI